MYIPLNPNQIEDCWNKLEKSLVSDRLCYIIVNKRPIENSSPRYFSPSDARELINRLKLMKYVQIGTHHLNLFPRHFAIELSSYTEGVLSDMITLDNSYEHINADISFIIEFTFLEMPILKTLIIPLKVDVNELLGSRFKIEIDEEKNVTKIIKY